MFTFSLFGIIYTFLIILIILDLKNIRSKKYVPIVMLIIQGILLVIIQMIKPELNYIINPSTVLTCLIMYFTIENPDMKMLSEVSTARDQADKANRAKSDFLSSMSHEIRTPLNAIVGLSEDIASYIDQVPPEVVEDTKDIQNASQTLLEIVGNILDISKIESNRMEIINAPYNLKEEVEGLCRVTSTRIGDKPIDYTLTIADDVPYELIGDKGKVKEIVNNLFTNSIKYTEKGKINLSIKCVNDFNNMYSTIYITCQDTGRGIKAESISRLFDKFDRLDVERNTTAEGTGLGLAITKKMIEMMGGKINVSSQFGVGSIFMVAIPQKISKIAKPEGEDELSDTARLANSNFDLGKRRILIVDDNNLNIKVATKALKDFNFELDSCNSGQECLDRFKAGEHYDLILMDIMMPVMSGETTLHTLQQSPAFTTPVIALTADAVAGAQEKYISAGFVDYIAKPFSRDQIKGKLEKIFIKGNE
jgi:signal transduction histidine kinase/ActR/RegA family two-component response regulator